MGRFVHWIRAFALSLGAPGLFLVAFLDSSILSLPEIADLLVIWMVTKDKAHLIFYVLAATTGSIAGCLILYYLGMKGGHALMRKRFGEGRVERTLERFRRHGIMAVLIPAILPPPAPFKIFVLLAGVADIKVSQFTMALAIGRGSRYLAEALLALWYGERALAFVREHGASVSLVVVGALSIGMGGYLFWSKAKAGTSR